MVRRLPHTQGIWGFEPLPSNHFPAESSPGFEPGPALKGLATVPAIWGRRSAT